MSHRFAHDVVPRDIKFSAAHKIMFSCRATISLRRATCFWREIRIMQLFNYSINLFYITPFGSSISLSVRPSVCPSVLLSAPYWPRVKVHSFAYISAIPGISLLYETTLKRLHMSHISQSQFVHQDFNCTGHFSHVFSLKSFHSNTNIISP